MPFRANRRGLYVWVQPDEKPRFLCTVITATNDGENTLCGKPFWTATDYERHVARCSAEHVGEIRRAAPSSRMPAFYGPESGIPDVERWLSETDAAGESNRAKVIQKRKRM